LSVICGKEYDSGILEDNNHVSRYLQIREKFLEFMIGNRLQGEYGYDPLTDKGKEPGLRFNKQTRAERKMLLSNFRTYCFRNKIPIK